MSRRLFIDFPGIDASSQLLSASCPNIFQLDPNKADLLQSYLSDRISVASSSDSSNITNVIRSQAERPQSRDSHHKDLDKDADEHEQDEDNDGAEKQVDLQGLISRREFEESRRGPAGASGREGDDEITAQCVKKEGNVKVDPFPTETIILDEPSLILLDEDLGGNETIVLDDTVEEDDKSVEVQEDRSFPVQVANELEVASHVTDGSPSEGGNLGMRVSSHSVQKAKVNAGLASAVAVDLLGDKRVGGSKDLNAAVDVVALANAEETLISSAAIEESGAVIIKESAAAAAVVSAEAGQADISTNDGVEKTGKRKKRGEDNQVGSVSKSNKKAAVEEAVIDASAVADSDGAKVGDLATVAAAAAAAAAEGVAVKSTTKAGKVGLSKKEKKREKDREKKEREKRSSGCKKSSKKDKEKFGSPGDSSPPPPPPVGDVSFSPQQDDDPVRTSDSLVASMDDLIAFSTSTGPAVCNDGCLLISDDSRVATPEDESKESATADTNVLPLDDVEVNTSISAFTPAFGGEAVFVPRTEESTINLNEGKSTSSDIKEGINTNAAEGTTAFKNDVAVSNKDETIGPFQDLADGHGPRDESFNEVPSRANQVEISLAPASSLNGPHSTAAIEADHGYAASAGQVSADAPSPMALSSAAKLEEVSSAAASEAASTAAATEAALPAAASEAASTAAATPTAVELLREFPAVDIFSFPKDDDRRTKKCCFKCGTEGHYIRNCPMAGKSEFCVGKNWRNWN